jgi:gamma-glutamylcysteine synthetase
MFKFKYKKIYYNGDKIGDLLEDDFSEPLADALKTKYPDLYEMLDKGVIYLDWENSVSELEYPENGDSSVSIYTDKSNDYIGTISFKVKTTKDEYGEDYYPNGIVKSSVKFKVESE